jgi:multidrug resistance efflux pump
MTAILERREQAGSLRDEAVKKRTKFFSPRPLKLGGTFIVLGLGAYAVWSDQAAIATDNAVVSSYEVAVRSPIVGMVTLVPRRVGDHINKGDLIGEVTNIRIDDQRPVDLREHLKRVSADLQATSAEQQSLLALRDLLEHRSKAYIVASSARLAGSVTEAERLLSVAVSTVEQAQRVLTRKTSLGKTGFTSLAELETAQSEFEIASRRVSAQQGRLDSLHAQALALDQGVVSEPGSNDVTYSQQRADEITIRLSELGRARSLAEADIEETTARLQSEELHVARMRNAPLVAPESGIIWKIDASDGEQLSTGDTVAHIVDCGQTFIIASMPQDRFPDIAVGSKAEYRLSGDSVKGYGRVVSVTGDATGGDHNLASIPLDQKTATVTVRILLDPAIGECLVGRTARVLLPPGEHSFFEHIFDRFR